MNGATRRQLTGVALAVGVVVVVSLLVSPSRVLHAVAELAEDPLTFSVVVLGAALLRPAVAWPMTPLVGVVGFVLGVTPLALALGLAVAVVTTVPPYVVARWYRPSEGVLGRLGTTGAGYFETTGDTRGVVVARLVPVPTDVASYGAGFSSVALEPYLLGTALGELPWVVAAVVAGSSMETLTTDGFSVGLPLVAGSLAVAALLLSGPLYRQLTTGTPE